jgi:5-methylthioadenosine/S-adenosylhomocysteine deaminase
MVTSIRLGDKLDEMGYLKETEESIKSFHGALDGLVTVAVHPSWPWNCKENLLVEGMRLAEEYDVQFATHLFERPDERALADERFAAEGGAVKYLDKLGLLRDRSLFFHCPYLNEEEIDLFAERGCSVSHNPSANARRGGCAYVPYMLEAGVRVGLGTDDPTSNLLTEMRVASMLHNVLPREKRGLRPEQAFELATMGSAAALGMDDQIGSLEVGKKADLITFDLEFNTDLVPLQQGYVVQKLGERLAGAETVDAMVDGKFLRRDGEFTTLDEREIIIKAGWWFEKFTRDYKYSIEEGESLYEIVHEEFTRI